MKKSLLFIALFTAIGTASFAQTTQQATPQVQSAAQQAENKQMFEAAKAKAEKQAIELQKQLGLTDEQKTRIAGVNTRVEMHEAMVKAHGAPANPAMESHMNDMKTKQYQAILTPEQFKKYSASQPAAAGK